MAGLFTSLTSTARALEAQRFGLDVAGQNIANLNTEGYARRRLQLVERVDGPRAVEVKGIRAERAPLLDARLRRELPAEGRESAVADSLGVVEASLGPLGESLDAQLTAFFDGFASVAEDPTSAVGRDNLLQQGQRLTRDFADLAERFDSARRAADLEVRGAAEEIAILSREVASLNRAIGNAGSADVDALRDQQQLALEKLASLAGVQVIPRAEGGADVALSNGRALVIGDTAYRFESVSTAPLGLASVQLEGVDVTADFQSGRLGGYLATRDSVIPTYQVRLDEMAYAVASSVNTRHASGYGLNGSTGQNFFAPLAGTAGAAAAVAIDPALVADPNRIAASQSGAPGDNRNAQALAGLRDARVLNGGTATLHDAWGQLVYRVGSDAQTARAEQRSRQEVVDQVTTLRDQVSGVSLDEEAAALIKFQRAYEANAKYFSTVDQALVTLLNMVGVA